MASIYILGDSHTQALGPRLESRLTGHSVTYEAFPGYSTKRALDAASIPHGQDEVVLSLGGNDFGNQEAARASLVAAVRARNPKANIVWFGPFHSTDAAVDARHAAQTLAQATQLPSLGVSWVDTRPLSPPDHAPDGVHFTGTGYSKIADSMLSFIRKGLSTGGGTLFAALAGTAAVVLLLLFARRR
jgi:lysophospholipase L1-like esterase